MPPLSRETPIQRFEKLRQAAVQARAPFEREAWLNLAFYLNQQYVEWDKNSNSIRQIPRDKANPNTPRPIVNKIMHFVQQERAMVLQAKPTVDILPASDDLMDITDTAVSKAYCDYTAEPINANLPRQLSRAALWAIITGPAWLKWVWNPLEQRADIVPCSIFEIAVDPYVTDFSKARYIFHSRFMDPEAVQDLYGVEVQPGKEEQADPMRSALLRGMGAAPVASGVTVHEMWHKPSAKYPKGVLAVWANGKELIPPGPLPYEHLREFRKLPFTPIGCIERPDSQYFMSPVQYLRSAQMELNKYHAQRLMIRENFAAPKWWVPNELELETPITNSPNQVLKGHSNGGMLRPEIIQPASYPPNDDGDMIEAQMMHIVGLHEVSQAQVPGRVEAAKAIEMLKESDADRQQTMLETIDWSIAEGFWHVLWLGKQYESPNKVLQVYSREGLPEVKHWKAEAIKPGMRVRVVTGTGLARSRAARQDQLMNMWQNRIITDPETMAELMEMPFPSFAQPTMLDMRLARNENLEIAKGTAVTPNSWDDHAIHLREHNNYRKTQDFLTSSEDVKKKFEYHCQLHDKLLDGQLAQQLQRAAASQAAAQAGFPQFAQPTPMPDAGGGAAAPAPQDGGQ